MHITILNRGLYLLITFEGIDGSGKTTQISLLKEYLEKKGKSVLCLREPGSTSISEKIRETLLLSKEDITPIAEVFLFCAARAQLVATVIKPALESGMYVICDRYIDSTVAYQGYGRGVSLEEIAMCNSLAVSELIPALTFILDVQPENANQRAESRISEKDRMEKAGNEFFHRVSQGYKQMAHENPQRIVLLDGTASIDLIHENICQSISRFL